VVDPGNARLFKDAPGVKLARVRERLAVTTRAEMGDADTNSFN